MAPHAGAIDESAPGSRNPAGGVLRPRRVPASYAWPRRGGLSSFPPHLGRAGVSTTRPAAFHARRGTGVASLRPQARQPLPKSGGAVLRPGGYRGPPGRFLATEDLPSRRCPIGGRYSPPLSRGGHLV